MAPAVIGYDWSVHCVGSQTDQDAKDEHLMSLRNEHGHSWSGVGSRFLPSYKQIYMDPLWRDSAKNVASLPLNYRPAPYMIPKTRELKAKSHRKLYDEKLICPMCTKRKTPEYLR